MYKQIEALALPKFWLDGASESGADCNTDSDAV